MVDQTTNITISIQSTPTFEERMVSNAVFSVRIATVKNSEEPATFEMVLNSLLTVNGLSNFQNGNVTQLTPRI